MRPIRKIVSITLSMCLLLAAGMARADIYGYVDAQGIAHFSAEKTDARYQLFARGDFSLDGKDAAEKSENGKLQAPSPALAKYLGGHPNLKKFTPLVQQAAKEFGLQPSLLKAVMAAESGFNPTAVSPKGAIGLMQIMPATAERYGLTADANRSLAQKLTDPKTNIRISARYLRDLHKLFPGKPELVLAAYNAGEGAVKKYKNAIPPYAETRNYVKLVSQFVRFYQPAVGSAANGSTVAVLNAADGQKRLRMTIPGRANMPPASTTFYQ